MRLSRLSFFALFFLLFAAHSNVSALDEGDWLSIYESEPTTSEVIVTEANTSGTHLHLMTAGVNTALVEWNETTYTTLTMPNTPHLSQPGAPEIPMISIWVAIPPTADVEISVQGGEYEFLTNRDVLPYSDYPEPEKRFMDTEIYQTNAFFPSELAQMQTPRVMRDVRFVPVQFFPVQVNPMTKEVRIYRDLLIEIRTIGNNGINPKTTNSPSPSPAFEKFYQKLMINYDQMKPYLFSDLRTPPDGLNLLIISPDGLVGVLDEFVEWKHQKGIRTYVADFSEIGGSSRNAIKTYIQMLYDDPETRPEYVLFIGDANVLPGWQNTGNLSDNPYGWLEGSDELLDIFMGRLPCQNSPLPLLTMINRTLEYEQDIYVDDSNWLKKAALICPQQSSRSIKFNHIGQELLVDEGDFVEVNEFSSWGGGSEVVEFLNNEGRNFLNYRGGISDYGVTPEYVDPQGKYPFVTWLTCGTCNYSTTDLCVRWLRDGNSDYPEGAIGAIGGSQVTTPEPYARRRDSLDKGIYEAIFLEDISSMGEIVFWGKQNVTIEYPLPDPYTEDTYNHFALMGDPTAEIWTEEPGDLHAEHMSIIPFGTFEFVVQVTNDDDQTPIAGATVALTRYDDDIFFKTQTDENGEAILDITIDQLAEYDLVVTAHNFYPYTTAVQAVPGMAFEGIVTNSDTGDPVPATIFVDGGFHTQADVETGFYRLYLAEEGEYQIQAERWGYYPYVSRTYTITEDDTITVDFVMNPYPSGTISGYVTDVIGNPIAGATVIARQEVDQPPVTTNENGYYEIVCPGSYTYDLVVSHPEYVTRSRSVTLPVDDAVTADMVMGLVIGFEDEEGYGFYRVDPEDNDWEHGTPTPEGGPEPYEGDQVWGTVLDGPYHLLQEAYLYTPEFFLLAEPGVNYHVQFQTWYEMVAEWDGGNFQISNDHGENWTLIHPENGYPDQSVAGIEGQAGYTGESGGWILERFDVSNYINEWVQFRFFFGTTNEDRAPRGWFIDKFVIYGYDLTVDVEGEVPMVKVPRRVRLHQNYPNPFNPVTTLTFEIPTEAPVTLQVYDIAGRLVETLLENEPTPAGQHTVEWRADPLPGGVYFYRLEVPDQTTQTKKAVLLK